MRLDVTPEQVAAALGTFPGLPHRVEEIGQAGRTLFINDSKATNADSSATALAAFESGIYWIAAASPRRAASRRSHRISRAWPKRT